RARFVSFTYSSSYVLAVRDFYALSLHDALPIFLHVLRRHDAVAGGLVELDGDAHREARVAFDRQAGDQTRPALPGARHRPVLQGDRKSTRLNSSHGSNSYAVSCLKKKKT